MPTFEISDGTGRYHVTADNEDAAFSAFQGLGKSPSAPETAPVAQSSAPAAQDPMNADVVSAPGQTPVLPAAPTNPTGRAQPAMNPDGSGSAFARGAGQGVTFGFGDEAMGALGAATGGDYAKARDESRALNHAADTAHPWAYTAGKVAGNVAGIIPAMALAPEALTVGGAGLLSRMGLSALGGAGVGAVQGLGEGEGSARDQLISGGLGAAGGAVGGALAPPIGQVIGRVTAPVAQALANRATPVPGLSNSAATMAAEDLANAGGRAAVDTRMGALGPDARLYHAGPSFEGTAQGLAVRPETREIISNDASALRQGANQRLAADLDAAAGPAPVPSQTEAQLAQKRTDLGPQYGLQEARSRPLSGDEAGGLWHLADSFASEQKGAGANLLTQAADALAPMTRNYFGEMVRIPDTSPQGLMASRRVIDGLLARVEESPQLQREGVGTRLQQIRQAVDDQVRSMNPEIKNLDLAYETFSDASAAHREGLNFLSRDVHPADISARFDAAPMEQQAAERLGARARIDREVGNTANDLSALKQVVKGDGDWNRQKLATYFGPDEANRIFNAVDRESAFADAYNRLTQNSMTAQRTEAAARFRPRGEDGNDLGLAVSTIGGPKAMALAIAQRGFKAANAEANRVADISRNQELANLITQQAGPGLNATLDALGRRLAVSGVGAGAGRNAQMLAEAILRSNGNEAAQYGRRALAR